MASPEATSPTTAERRRDPSETLVSFDDGSINAVWNGRGDEYDFSRNCTYGGLGGPDITGITVQHYDEHGTRSRLVFIEHSMVRFDTDELGKTTSRFTKDAYAIQEGLRSAPLTIGGTSNRFGGSKVEEIYALRSLDGDGLLGRGANKVAGKANPLMVALDIFRDKLNIDQ